MYNAIKKFLVLHHHLALPGIGNFKIETVPAEIDIANRSIKSSHNKIVFSNDKLPAEKKFYSFLSHELKIDEVQSVRAFTNFTAQLQDKLHAGNIIEFAGIGTLKKQSGNTLTFQQQELPVYFPSIPAERIIRKNVMHTVRVGEEERTSEEMQTVLHQPAIIKKERWWIAAIILAVIGITAIVFYYASH